MTGGGIRISLDHLNKGVLSNIISVTRGWEYSVMVNNFQKKELSIT